MGCVLVDSRNHVLATGYNGVPGGIPHCIDQPCGAENAKSGDALDGCLATHAEVNAVLQCRDPYEIKTVYTTTSPCIHCIKILMNTSVERIVFAQEYSDPRPKELWLRLHPESSWVLLNSVEGG